MLLKTQGVVLKYIKYKESSIICKIFTRQLGVQSFILNGIRTKSSKNKIALLQPLSLLDLVIYNSENSTIKRISEMKLSYATKTSAFLIKKSAIILFLSEALDKLLRESTPNEDIYDFIKDALIDFDLATENFDNFHLHFLLSLTSFLGIQPMNAQEMLDNTVNNKIYFEERELATLDSMILNPFDVNLPLNKILRKKTLEAIINFYQCNVEGFGEIRSLKVLKDVFS